MSAQSCQVSQPPPCRLPCRFDGRSVSVPFCVNVGVGCALMCIISLAIRKVVQGFSGHTSFWSPVRTEGMCLVSGNRLEGMAGMAWTHRVANLAVSAGHVCVSLCSYIYIYISLSLSLSAVFAHTVCSMGCREDSYEKLVCKGTSLSRAYHLSRCQYTTEEMIRQVVLR